MAHATHPPETDLLLPLPEAGEDWNPHTIHTYYFGASVPEAALQAFIYLRCQPAFPLSQGGICIFSGLDNIQPLDMDFVDYQMTMPWPEIDGNTIRSANGLEIEFTEPGRQARVSYRSRDGETSVELTQTAISPLIARGHVAPGEETDSDPAQLPGGSEQYMKVSGEIVVRGERHEVDCQAPRDRSWRQVRAELQGGSVPIPAVGWSPMCFGEDLIFNQISIEDPATDPVWAGHFELPPDRPTHHFAWLFAGGELREITRVRRNVLAHHPELQMALRQEIEATDSDGNTHLFRGEALAMAPVPAWPNAGFRDSLYRWESEDGRIAHSTYQELWADRYQRVMREPERR